MQTCKHCQQSLPFESFYKTDRSPSGYRGVCKSCSLKANKKRAEKSRQHLNKSPTEPLPMPSIELINALFFYDGKDLVRSKSAGSSKKGSIATRDLHGTGYLCVTIDSIRYLAHRVIWFMHHGTEPRFIDHINRNKKDNRIANLRESTAVGNRSNTDVISSNTTGLIGVYWYPYKGAPKWRVACGDVHIGYFRNRVSAARAYNRHVLEVYGEEAEVKVQHNKRVIKEETGIEI